MPAARLVQPLYQTSPSAHPFPANANHSATSNMHHPAQRRMRETVAVNRAPNSVS